MTRAAVVLGALAIGFVSPRLAWAAAPTRVAVIVSANRGPLDRGALRYAHRDAEELASALTEVGGFDRGDVWVLHEPKPAEVVAKLAQARERLTGEAAQAGKTMLLFYYSGHADAEALLIGPERLPWASVREQLEQPGPGVRVGVVDTCQGGGFTRTKGVQLTAPFESPTLSSTSEGSVLLASSSGLESAHESDTLMGSFFTHHLVAGMRGAADQSGDGAVTMAEVFSYARELTLRDSVLWAGQAQHPSFDMKLKGRRDLVLARSAQPSAQIEWAQRQGPVELIDVESGLRVTEVQAGERRVRLSLRPGRYLLRKGAGRTVFVREVRVAPASSLTLDEGSLELVGRPGMSAKGPRSDNATLDAREVEASLALGLNNIPGRSRHAGFEFVLAHPGFSLGSVFQGALGISDRWQWSVPFPHFTYGIGALPVEGALWGGVSRFGYSDGRGLIFTLGGGGGLRVAAGDRARVWGSVDILYTTDMRWLDGPFRLWSPGGAVGVTWVPVPGLRLSFGAALILEPNREQASYGFSTPGEDEQRMRVWSVVLGRCSFAQRRLPTVQYQLLDWLSLDLDVGLSVDVSVVPDLRATTVPDFQLFVGTTLTL